MLIIKRLQTVAALDVFTLRAVYDGRKNIFALRRLHFGPPDTQEFRSMLTDTASPSEAAEAEGEARKRKRGPRVYNVKLALMNTMNTELLRRFISGRQSHDNDVLTAITALNVMRMQPSLDYPLNTRSFFNNRGTKDIAGGNCALARLLPVSLNVDMTTCST